MSIGKILYYREMLPIRGVDRTTYASGRFAKIQKNSYMPHGAENDFEIYEVASAGVGLFSIAGKKKPVSKAMKVY
jgi:hypothetical protein